MSVREPRRLKAGLDRDDCRKQRNLVKVELRKAKREEGLQKRRNLIADSNGGTAGESCGPMSHQALSILSALASRVFGWAALNGPNEGLDSCIQDVRALRKLLAITGRPPIDEVIALGLLPALVQMLGHHSSKLQFESAWCLTNIASGSTAQCAAVVEHKAIPPLVRLLSSGSLEVSEQAAWALGNVAGDCSNLRDVVLSHGALEQLISLIQNAASLGHLVPLRNACWALSNLLRGKPAPDHSYVVAAFPVLARLLLLDDTDLLVDVCWAVSSVSDSSDDLISLLLGYKCVPRLVELLQSGGEPLEAPALRALCNIVSGSDAATQAVLEAGFLEQLPRLLSSPRAQIRKEGCWAVSNIAAGTPEQASLLLQGSLMPQVLNCLAEDEVFEVKKEALCVLYNLLQGYSAHPGPHSAQRTAKIAQLGCIRPLVLLLDVKDPSLLRLVLEATDFLLSAGVEIGRMVTPDGGGWGVASGWGMALDGSELFGGGGDFNIFLAAFDEAQGVDKLELLLEHENEQICAFAEGLLEKYFGDDGEDAEIAPASTADAFCFAPFGAPAPLPVSPAISTSIPAVAATVPGVFP